MNYGFVRVGAFTPKIKVADTQANTAEIKKLIDQAEKEHTALAVFPELCITGYTCGDLFLQSRLLNSSREALEELAEYARFGNAAASICVEKKGAIPAMPKLTQVEERLEGKK